MASLGKAAQRDCGSPFPHLRTNSLGIAVWDFPDEVQAPPSSNIARTLHGQFPEYYPPLQRISSEYSQHSPAQKPPLSFKCLPNCFRKIRRARGKVIAAGFGRQRRALRGIFRRGKYGGSVIQIFFAGTRPRVLFRPQNPLLLGGANSAGHQLFSRNWSPISEKRKRYRLCRKCSNYSGQNSKIQVRKFIHKNNVLDGRKLQPRPGFHSVGRPVDWKAPFSLTRKRSPPSGAFRGSAGGAIPPPRTRQPGTQEWNNCCGFHRGQRGTPSPFLPRRTGVIGTFGTADSLGTCLDFLAIACEGPEKHLVRKERHPGADSRGDFM